MNPCRNARWGICHPSLNTPRPYGKQRQGKSPGNLTVQYSNINNKRPCLKTQEGKTEMTPEKLSFDLFMHALEYACTPSLNK